MMGPIGPALVQALSLDGFKPRIVESGYEFVGELHVLGQAVAARLVFEDREFTELPRLILTSPEKLPRAVVAHLDEEGELCAIDRRLYAADRHNAPAEARGVLKRAAEVLAAGLTEPGEKAIAAEFPQHWAKPLFVADFGLYDGFVGIVPLADKGDMLVPQRAGAPPSHNAVSVTTTATLSFKSDQRRPETVGDLLGWASLWDATLPDRIINALGSLTSDDPFLVIAAPNGLIGVRVLVSDKHLVEALRRPQGWRAALASNVGHALPIRRMRGQRVDIAHVLGRNSSGTRAPLAGLSILLVGCGSIGGHLAHGLAQLGAGLAGGHISLIDPELLDGSNIARHRLGASDRNAAKALALQASIRRDLPGLDVSAARASIVDRPHLFRNADLVVDATGEVGVSQMLNSWLIEGLKGPARKSPALLHVWLEGNGAAVRSFLNMSPSYACRRCLDSEFGKPRYRVLHDGALTVVAGTCGDPVYTPYGPSAPLAAAAIATQHVADWAAGRGAPLLRTSRLDLKNTKDCKPADPPRQADCPACN